MHTEVRLPATASTAFDAWVVPKMMSRWLFVGPWNRIVEVRPRTTMTLPFEYQNPTLQFERFMVDARDCASLATTNMAWNMVVGVLHAFRHRLSVNQALAFAAVLPPMIRALFIEDWNPQQAVLPFGEPADWLADVRSVRPEHNFSPPDAVVSVATALSRHVDTQAFERVLALLPAEARRYWQPRSPSSSGPASNAV